MRHVLTLAWFGLASCALAQHAGDISLIVEPNGKMRTARQVVLPSGKTLTLPERVFPAEFSDLGGVVFSDEPGWDVQDGTLPASSLLGFDIHKALRVWDGSGFGTIPAETLTIELGPQSRTTPGSDVIVPGFGLKVDEEGGLHAHFEYVLDLPASTGVYLLELSMWSDAGLTGTRPFWIVFNHGMDELTHDEAVFWVYSNYVPSPGAAAVVLGLGVFSLGRRRGVNSA